MKKTSLVFLGSTVQKYAKISVTKGGGAVAGNKRDWLLCHRNWSTYMVGFFDSRGNTFFTKECWPGPCIRWHRVANFEWDLVTQCRKELYSRSRLWCKQSCCLGPKLWKALWCWRYFQWEKRYCEAYEKLSTRHHRIINYNRVVHLCLQHEIKHLLRNGSTCFGVLGETDCMVMKH